MLFGDWVSLIRKISQYLENSTQCPSTVNECCVVGLFSLELDLSNQ